MNFTDDQVAVDYFSDMYALGHGTDELIVAMKGNGISIVRSIIVLSRVLHFSPRSAKQLVTDHPIWQEEVDNALPLHNQLEVVFREPEE
jgi:hypothetical protein